MTEIVLVVEAFVIMQNLGSISCHGDCRDCKLYLLIDPINDLHFALQPLIYERSPEVPSYRFGRYQSRQVVACLMCYH